MRKNTSKKNENLLINYRRKLMQNLNEVTLINYQKIIFLLSRSTFPFSELILNEILLDPLGKKQFRSLVGLKMFHYNSLMPSLGKIRYNQLELINNLSTLFL